MSKKEISKFSLQVDCWEVHSHISREQFRFSKFSLQVLLPLPHIQTKIFRIQIAGFWNSVCRYYNNFHISKRNFWNSACRLTVERFIPTSLYNNFDFRNSDYRSCNHLHVSKEDFSKCTGKVTATVTVGEKKRVCVCAWVREKEQGRNKKRKRERERKWKIKGEKEMWKTHIECKRTHTEGKKEWEEFFTNQRKRGRKQK